MLDFLMEYVLPIFAIMFLIIVFVILLFLAGIFIFEISQGGAICT